MPNLSGLAFIILSTGLVLQVVSAAKLLPFGDAAKHRDSKQVLTNDSSFTINNLTQPLKFFGREYHSIIVSEDGYLHFDYCSFDPHVPTFDKHLIAPLWHQYEQATVYYRQTTKPFDLDGSTEYLRATHHELVRFKATWTLRASEYVRATHPDFGSFKATWALVVTWYNATIAVPDPKNLYYPGGNTYQVVLTTNSNATFAIFLYHTVTNAAYASVGVNGGLDFYKLCITHTQETVNLASLRSCDGEPGVFGFQIDDIDMDLESFKCLPTDTEYPASQCECKMMDLPKDEIGFYINVTKVGEYLIYTCDDAYDLVDDNTVYCVFNGTQAIWDGLRHSCRKRPVWFDPPADGYDATEVMEHMTRLDKVLFELNATSENGVHYELVQSRPSGPLQFAVKDNYLRLAPGTDRKSLDVENPNTTLIYLLQFRATDKIYGIYSDSYLIVEIIDENDNVPIFSKNTYYAAINQDDPIGKTVLIVSASDSDATSPNNAIVFSILDADDTGYFSIGAHSGKITITNRPDPIVYKLTILASDASPEALAASVIVTIKVKPGSGSGKDGEAPTINSPESGSSDNSNSTLLLIVVIVAVVAVALVLGFIYRRWRGLSGLPNISAIFNRSSQSPQISLNNPNFVASNPNADLQQPGGRGDNSYIQSDVQMDFNSDTDMLTTSSWAREQEKYKNATK